jgi:hypothetical protein
MINKKLGIATVLFLLITISAQAQLVSTPQISPRAFVEQIIGASKVSIDYGRPAVKDREVWGKLVPYGLTTFPFGNGKPAPWRAGANENTVITFSDDVIVEGKALPAGSYGFHIHVNPEQWTLIFSSNTTSWGSFFYEESEDVLRVDIKPEAVAHQEWLDYGFENLTMNSASVFLHWEKLKGKFKIEFDTDDLAMKSMKNDLRGMAGFTWQGYQQAAFYCLQNNVHLDQGYEWIQKSISINKNEQNQNLLGYVLMAQSKMDEAEKVFKEIVEDNPDSWNAHDSLGEFYKNSGNKKNAKKWYKKAHKMSPDGQKKRIEGILKELE